MVTKKCSKCGGSKSLDEFHLDRSKTDGHVSICKICANLKTKYWYKCNREHALEYQRNYGSSRKDEKREYDKRYRALNQAIGLQRARQWVANNPNARKAIQHRYQEIHRDEINRTNRDRRNNNIEEARIREQHNRDATREQTRARIRKWKHNNPDKVRIDRENNRAQNNGASGKFTKYDIQRIYSIQDGVCIYHDLNPSCLVDLNFAFHIDHITPISRGGTNYPDNLQLLCHLCNESKGTKTDIEYRDWLSRVYPK